MPVFHTEREGTFYILQWSYLCIITLGEINKRRDYGSCIFIFVLIIVLCKVEEQTLKGHSETTRKVYLETGKVHISGLFQGETFFFFWLECILHLSECMTISQCMTQMGDLQRQPIFAILHPFIPFPSVHQMSSMR